MYKKYKVILSEKQSNDINLNFINAIYEFDIGINDLRWYVFNIADTSITIGAILYILVQYKYNKKNNVISRDI